MLYYLLFWAILGFIIHFYITFGTNLLTGGPTQICCFFAYFSVLKKRNIRRSRNGTKSTREVIFGTPPDGLGPHVKEGTRCSRGWGRAHPLGRAPCLVGPPWLLRRTSCTHIYRRTLKLPERTIDREFRCQKPP